MPAIIINVQADAKGNVPAQQVGDTLASVIGRILGFDVRLRVSEADLPMTAAQMHQVSAKASTRPYLGR